jgi:hypothetical protein
MESLKVNEEFHFSKSLMHSFIETLNDLDLQSPTAGSKPWGFVGHPLVLHRTSVSFWVKTLGIVGHLLLLYRTFGLNNIE